MSFVQEGDYVLLTLNDENNTQMLCRVVQKSKLRLKGKSGPATALSDLVGHPFGSSFSVSLRGDLERISFTDIQSEEMAKIEKEIFRYEKMDGADVQKDNRMLFDDSKAQGMTQEEIRAMKKEADGSTIIHQLVDSSNSFKEKTQYSKAKYLNKLSEKYDRRLKVERPTAARMLNYLLKLKLGYKVLFLTPASLASILYYAEIRPKSNIIVCDDCMGYLSSAILERMDKSSKLFVVKFSKAHLEGFSILGFDRGNMENVSILSIYDLKRLSNDNETEGQEQGKSEENSLNHREEAILELRKGVDALIVAPPSTLDPVELCEILLPLLKPSRPLIYYSSFFEPVTKLHVWLKSSQKYFFNNLSVFDCFFRPYQVLPGRTHPSMREVSQTGWLLTGTTVEKPRSFQEVHKEAIQRKKSRLDK